MGTPDTDVTSPPPPSSEDVCPPRRLTSRCSTFRTRTPLTSLSGFPTTSNLPFAISHQRDSRWPSLSSETPPPSRRCSNVSESNSPPCSAERPSSIGTPPKTRKRWKTKRWNDRFASTRPQRTIIIAPRFWLEFKFFALTKSLNEKKKKKKKS